MNNKFKRFNKILMMTVAILLCFVLISTSVVSGIFAKYVITRSAGATVSLKAFGITLSVDGKTGTGITVTKNPNGSSGANTLSVTVAGLQVLPGKELDDVVYFKISGTPNVDNVNLKIKVAVDGYNNFGVTDTNIKSITPVTTGLDIPESKYYIPFGCSMKTATNVEGTGAVKTTVLAAELREVASNAAFATLIRDGLIDKAAFSKTGSTTDTAEKVITNTSGLTIRYLSFGFNCWASGGTLPTDVSATEADLIQTYLQTKTTSPTFTVTYTVSLEQVV